MTATDRPALAAALARQPRLPLAALPTPLQEARGCATRLGGPARCPRIFVKRDDLTGLAGGGNKARKLEFLVGDAQRAGATTLITTGAVQSNHARMTAGAARIAGMSAELVLTAHAAAPDDEGNLLLDRLFGARVHFVPSIDPMLAVGHDEETVREVAAAVRARGGMPYVIPVGGSSAHRRPRLRGRHAGAVHRSSTRWAWRRRGSISRAARAALRPDSRWARICAGRGSRCTALPSAPANPRSCERARRVAREAAALLGADDSVLARPFVTDQAFIGEGYGLPTPDGLEAMLLAGPHRGAGPRPHLHGQGDGRAHRSRARRRASRPTSRSCSCTPAGSPAIFARGRQRRLAPSPDGRFCELVAVRLCAESDHACTRPAHSARNVRTGNDLARSRWPCTGSLCQDEPVRCGRGCDHGRCESACNWARDRSNP